MATLLERLQKQMGAKPQAEFSGEAEKAAALLRAKRGKAVGTTGPGASSLAEKQAVAGTQSALDQEALQGTLAGQQMATQAQAQTEQQSRQLQGAQLQQQAVVGQLAQREAAALGDFERSGKKLDADRDGAKLEQLGFDIRLQNREYLDNLQREGATRRLDNGAEFQIALQESVFEDMKGLFADDLEFQEFMNMDDAEFQKRMGDIDINYALEVANKTSDAAAKQAQFQGIGNVVSGAAKGYQAYEDKNKEGGSK